MATPIRPLSQGGGMFVDCLPTYIGTIDLIRRPDHGAGWPTRLDRTGRFCCVTTAWP